MNVKPCEADGSAQQVKESNEIAGSSQVYVELAAGNFVNKEHAPDVQQDGRRNAERYAVGKRIELPAEVTGGVRHASDAAIQAVEKDGKP